MRVAAKDEWEERPALVALRELRPDGMIGVVDAWLILPDSPDVERRQDDR